MVQTGFHRKQRRIGALIPEAHAKALDKAAEENGRTLASEIRMAVEDWLRKQGRIAG